MFDYKEANIQDRKRRRRELIIIGILLIFIPFLTYLGFKVFDIGIELPISGSILVFALININVILLLLLLFLTVRNLVKLLFERKRKIMGARLRTRLVLAFLTLSLFPTIIIFFVSVQFISSSLEYWFKLPIERSLARSLEVGQDYLKSVDKELFFFGNNLSRLITYNGYMLIVKKDELQNFINTKRIEYGLSAVRVFSKRVQLRAESVDDKLDISQFKGPSIEKLRLCLEKGMDIHDIQSSPIGELMIVILPVFSRTESKAVVGVISVSKFIPKIFVNRLKSVSQGYQEYKQLKFMKKPIKVSHLITLSIVTLLIIFSSVWFGFFLSKGITVPIQEVAEGTRRIASGDYNFYIDLESEDEIGILVNSFNKMTSDLKNSKLQLEKAHRELINSNIELEKRKLYMEIVLQNIASGVVSADEKGNILTINKSAERMLQVKAEDIIGKNYKEIIGEEYSQVINDFLNNKELFKKGFMEKQITISVGEKNLTLLVYLNVLRDDQGKYLGLVAVFENITELERAQRVAAWREVARRIAHEVKNPLTPIKLSAQRLKMKYGDKLTQEDGKIFNECTDMIINQVEELKRLVNEFSRFAKMPDSNPVPDRMDMVVTETLGLFAETGKDIKFEYVKADNIPFANIDREQMKRALINIIDNAIDAVDGQGEIMISLSHDADRNVIRLEIADNGKGIPPEDKPRLFDPYFSTKKHGTGLGLTIVNTIINDHNGKIRVEDNIPKGARFIIEIPALA